MKSRGPVRQLQPPSVLSQTFVDFSTIIVLGNEEIVARYVYAIGNTRRRHLQRSMDVMEGFEEGSEWN